MIVLRNEYTCDEGYSKYWETEVRAPLGHEVGRMLFGSNDHIVSQTRCRNHCEALRAGAYNWRDQKGNNGRINGCRCYSHKASERIKLIRTGEDWLFCRKDGKFD